MTNIEEYLKATRTVLVTEETFQSMKENMTKWIPINEKLPEDGNWGLFTDGKNMSVERYKSDAIDHFFPEGRWFSFDEVIAWRPLPEPYKNDEWEHVTMIDIDGNKHEVTFKKGES